MYPHLTANGRVLLVTSVTLMVLAVTTAHPTVLLWGEMLAVLVTVEYYLQLAAFHAIEGGFIGLALKPRSTGRRGGGVVGRPESIDLELVNLSGVPLARLELEPELSEDLGFDPPRIELNSIGGRRRIGFTISLTAGVPGRWMLHGFRLRAEGFCGLVAVSEYIPMPYPFKFLPATALARQGITRRARRFVEVQRMGAHPLWQRGFGTNFRELRDHLHGDPFRSIAWKATARTGKLMVREFEDEIISNTTIILDISSTMRGGTPPRTKLVHAVELVCDLAATTVRSRDRIGLVTFDEVVYGHIKTTNARVGVPQMVNHLVGLWSVVDNDFTEQDEEEVTETLVNYLSIQDRLDFRLVRKGRRGAFEGEGIDRNLLASWLRRVLPEQTERFADPSFDAGVVGYRRIGGVRRFCQLRGLVLPYRFQNRFGAKEGGMVQALERFLEDTRDSHFVLIISDLCALTDMRRLVNALTVVLDRKHRVLVWMPYTPDYIRIPPDRRTSPSGPQEMEALERVFRQAEHRERSRVVWEVTSLGIPVIPVAAVDTLESLLARSHRYRRYL